MSHSRNRAFCFYSGKEQNAYDTPSVVGVSSRWTKNSQRNSKEFIKLSRCSNSFVSRCHQLVHRESSACKFDEVLLFFSQMLFEIGGERRSKRISRVMIWRMWLKCLFSTLFCCQINHLNVLMNFSLFVREIRNSTCADAHEAVENDETNMLCSCVIRLSIPFPHNLIWFTSHYVVAVDHNYNSGHWDKIDELYTALSWLLIAHFTQKRRKIFGNAFTRCGHILHPSDRIACSYQNAKKCFDILSTTISSTHGRLGRVADDTQRIERMTHITIVCRYLFIVLLFTVAAAVVAAMAMVTKESTDKFIVPNDFVCLVVCVFYLFHVV